MAIFGNAGFSGRNRGRRYDDRGNNNNGRNNGRQPIGAGGFVPKWNRRYFRELTAVTSYGNNPLLDMAANFERVSKDQPRQDSKDNRNQKGNNNRPKRRWEEPVATPQAKPVEAPAPKQEKHSQMKESLDSFVSEYASHLNDGAYLKQLMVESFSGVLKILRKYGDDRFNDLNDSMDRVFNLLCTDQLSNLLLNLIQENAFEDTWDDDWKNLAVVITIILANYGSRINDTSAKARYINEIIPSSAMWKPEIDKLEQEYHITRDMAVDLVLKVPVLPEDMKLWDLNQFVYGFEDVIFTHGKDNITVLDAAAQGDLFDFSFGKGTHIPPKAISRLLASPEIDTGDGTPESDAIHGAFREMLYTKLNKFDIGEIEKTLDYIIRERKKIEQSGNDIQITIWNAAEASQFDQITKAINNMVEKDEANKQYLI